MPDYREEIADAAYFAWRSGRDYESAWYRAEEAIDSYGPCDRYEAEEVAQRAAYGRRRQEEPDTEEPQL